MFVVSILLGSVPSSAIALNIPSAPNAYLSSPTTKAVVPASALPQTSPANQHPNHELIPLLDDRNANRIRDTLDEKAIVSPDATVFLHLLYDRRPSASDADLLESHFGALRTYVFSNWDWIKVEAHARDVPRFLQATGVIGIEEFVPPVSHNVVAAQTTRVREVSGINDGLDHTLSVNEDLGFQGEGMVIAILDTGVDNTHEILDDLDDDPTTIDPKLVVRTDGATGDLIIGGADASTGFDVVGCVDPLDDHLHGTHVAGTALGTRGGLTGLDSRGAAPQARLVDVDIAVPLGPGLAGGLVNPIGSAAGLGIDAGVDWILDYNQGETCFGDPGEFAIDVASMSFGGTGLASPGVTTNVAITDVVQSGIVFIQSAGNSGANPNTLGAGAEGAIIVAASDDRGNPSRSNDYLAYFSSRGPRGSDGDADSFDELRPDIAAPGVSINSALHHGVVVTVGASGTSMSAPHVAGVAALMLQAAQSEGIDLRPVAAANWRDMGLEGAVPIRDLMQKTAQYRDEVQPGYPAVQSTTTGKFGLPWNNGWGYGLLDAYAAVQAAMERTDGGTPVISITSPLSGSSVEAGPTTIEGTVDPDGADLGLLADAGGPYAGLAGTCIALDDAQATGGDGSYTYLWTATPATGTATFTPDPETLDPCVTFTDVGAHTVEFQVEDGTGAQDSAATTVTVGSGDEPGTHLGTDPAGDRAPGPVCDTAGGNCVATTDASMDIVSVAAADDLEKLYIYVTMEDMATNAARFHLHVDFVPSWVPSGEMSFIAQIDAPDSGTGVGVFVGVAGVGARTTTNLAVTIDGNVITIAANKADILAPLEGDEISEIRLASTNPVTLNYNNIDVTDAFGPYAIGSQAPNSMPSLPIGRGPGATSGRPAPTAAPADAQVQDGADEIDDVEAGAFDVEAAWFEADADTLYVGLKVAGFADPQEANSYVIYNVNFKPSWSATDPSWGGSVATGAVFDGLRVQASFQPVKINEDLAPETHDVFLFELHALSHTTTQGQTRNFFGIIDTLSGTVDPATGILWFPVPRALVQSPQSGDQLDATSADSGLSAAGAGNFNKLDSAPSFDGTGESFVFADDLIADAGGPYAGAPGVAIDVAGSFVGGDGTASCEWTTTDDGAFADATSCATLVTFDTAGTKSVTLTVQDATATASDEATVVVSSGPAGEVVKVSVDGATVEDVAVDTSAGADAWSAVIDLSSGEHTIRASWFDAEGTLLDEDEIILQAGPSESVSIESPSPGSTVEPPVLFEGSYQTGTSEASSSSTSQTSGTSTALANAKIVQTDWYAALVDELSQHSGFVGLLPGTGNTLTAQFVGEAPSLLPLALVPVGWTLKSQGGVTLTKARIPLDLGGSEPQSRVGPPLPDTSSGIGPGSGIIISIPVAGTFGCTANFIWRDATTGKHYLGAAGHCFLPDTATATHGPGADYNAAGVRTWVCVQSCDFGGLSGQLLTSYTAELGRVAYARQGPGTGAPLGTGDDFGLVEIPVALYDLVRTYLPVWNGPKSGTGTMGNGQLILQYGHSIVFGETFLTQARAGVITLPWNDEGPWYALHPGAQGDSGSAVVMGALTDPEGTVVEGTGALGILTHLGAPFGTTAGTFVDHAVVMAREAGLDVSIITEGSPLVLPGLTAQFTATVSRLNVQFTDGSFSPDGIVERAWNFGDGQTSAEANPSHDYAAIGTYTVTLTVTDGEGAQATATQDIAVTGDPDPSTPNLPNGDSVEVDLASGEEKHFKIAVPDDATTLSVTMTGPACDAIECPLDADLYVRFGARPTDATYDCRPFETGNDESCAVNDPTAGLWYVRVHAFSGFGTVELTATQDGSDNTAPTASFTVDGDGLSVAFDGSGSTDPDGDLLSYAWDFGDNATASGAATSHAYAAAGTYDVTLTVDDGRGGTAQTSQAVTVTETPPGWSVAIRLHGPDGLVQDWTTVATAHDDEDGQWSHVWEPTQTPAEGEYEVEAALRNGDTIMSTTSSIFNLDLPNAAPTAAFTGPAEAGAAETVVFDASPSTDSDGEIASYEWSFGDGSVGEGAVVSHAFGQRGTFTVTLTVRDDHDATDSVTHDIEIVNGGPTARFQAPETADKATEVTFDARASSDPDGIIASYAWDFGDGTTATGSTVTRAFARGGAYDVTLVVTDNDGAKDTRTQSITIVNHAPSASFTVDQANKRVDVDASETTDADGDALTFAWDFGDGATASTVTASHKYKEKGTHTITLRVSDGDGEDVTVTQTVTV